MNGCLSRVRLAAAPLVLLAPLAPLASAGGLDARQVPADVRWVAHVDVEALLRSQLFAALREGEGAIDADLDFAEIEAQFGIDPLEDVRGITVYNAGPGEQDTAVVVHASAEVDRLTAKLAAVPNHRELVLGSRTIHLFEDGEATWYGSIEPIPTLPGAAGSGGDAGRLVVLARGEDLYTRAIDLVLGHSPSLATSEEPSIRARPAAGSIVFAAASQSLAELAEVGDQQASAIVRLAKSFVLDVGESSGALSVRLSIDTQKPEDALRVQQVFQGASALLSLVGQDPAQGDRIQRLIGALHFEATGSQMNATFRYPVGELLREVRALGEAHEDQ